MIGPGRAFNPPAAKKTAAKRHTQEDPTTKRDSSQTLLCIRHPMDSLQRRLTRCLPSVTTLT